MIHTLKYVYKNIMTKVSNSEGGCMHLPCPLDMPLCSVTRQTFSKHNPLGLYESLICVVCIVQETGPQHLPVVRITPMYR